MPGKEEINDRFSTTWKSGYDPRALAYAARHKINFEVQGIMTYDSDNNPHYSIGSTDMVALQEANLKSIDEERARHAADPEIGTGTDILLRGIEWEDYTRGLKLRTISRCKREYSMVLNHFEHLKAHVDHILR